MQNDKQPIRSFKDLLVWQKAMDLVVSVYGLSKRYPTDEQFALTSQTRRAVISVPANIAEGYGRNTRKEYANFLRISAGSLAELETLIIVAERLSYGTAGERSTITEQIGEIGRMLYSMRAKLRLPGGI